MDFIQEKIIALKNFLPQEIFEIAIKASRGEVSESIYRLVREYCGNSKYAPISDELEDLAGTVVRNLRRLRDQALPRAARKRFFHDGYRLYKKESREVMPRKLKLLGRRDAEVAPTKPIKQRLKSCQVREARRAAEKTLRRYANMPVLWLDVYTDYDLPRVFIEKDGSKRFYTIHLTKGYLCIPEWLRTIEGNMVLEARREPQQDNDDKVWHVAYAKKIQGGYKTTEGYAVERVIDGVLYRALSNTPTGARQKCARQTPEYLDKKDDIEARRKESLHKYQNSIAPMLKKLPFAMTVEEVKERGR